MLAVLLENKTILNILLSSIKAIFYLCANLPGSVQKQAFQHTQIKNIDSNEHF